MVDNSRRASISAMLEVRGSSRSTDQFDYELVPRWISGGPDAAIEILGTVAASMVSLTALVLMKGPCSFALYAMHCRS
jgi:uncharacterized membrane protein